MQFMRIDFHTHAFPDDLAPSAISRLSREGGGLTAVTDGTVDGLIRRMDESRVDVSVVLNIAVKPSHHVSILKSCLHMRSHRIVPFASVHPASPDALETLEEIARQGIQGVKFHPYSQGFEADDPAFFPVYRKIAHLGLICVFHAGMDVAFPPPCPCSPERIARALPAFDGSPVVAAHFGGYMMWQEALSAYKGTGIYLDTSYSHSRVIMPVARELVQMAGTDHLLYGSDAPWSDPAREAMAVQCLGLSPEEEKMVFCDNARRLLGLNLS